METFVQGLQWYIVFLFSTTLHEAAHAFTALKLGDSTGYEGGQVTLDPIPHIKREPMGTVVVPIVSFLLGGWMMGWASVPYSREWALNYPKRSAIMSLAGPASNLLLVILVSLIIRAGMLFDIFYAPDKILFTSIVSATHEGAASIAATFLSLFFSLNLLLFLFNLFPFPPLDGSGAIPLFLSHENAQKYLQRMYNSPSTFLGIFIVWNIFDYVYRPVHLFAINLLYPEFGYH
jgi:Zn-dependent protease